MTLFNNKEDKKIIDKINNKNKNDLIKVSKFAGISLPVLAFCWTVYSSIQKQIEISNNKNIQLKESVIKNEVEILYIEKSLTEIKDSIKEVDKKLDRILSTK